VCSALCGKFDGGDEVTLPQGGTGFLGFFVGFHSLPGAAGAADELLVGGGVFLGGVGLFVHASGGGVDALVVGGGLGGMAAVEEDDVVEEGDGAEAGAADEDIPVFDGGDVFIEDADFFEEGAADRDEAGWVDAGVVDDGFEGGGLVEGPGDDGVAVKAGAFALELGEAAGFDGLGEMVDHVGEAVGADHGGLAVEGVEEGGEGVGEVDIVGIHEGDVGGGGGGEGEAGVAGGGDAGVGLAEEAEAGIAGDPLFDDGGGGVFGAVIDEDAFPIGEGLGADGIEGFDDETLDVVGGDDDGEAWGHGVATASRRSA
jgi:hypothetical protein